MSSTSDHQPSLALKSARHWPSTLMHWAYNLYILGTIFGVLYGYVINEDLQARDLWIARIITLSTGTLVCMLLGFLVYFAVSYSNKARYAEILSHSHEVHHLIRDLQSEIINLQTTPRSSTNTDERKRIESQVASGFRRILTEISTGFSVAKGVRCRSSIKLLGRVEEMQRATPDNLFVRTLARDFTSSHECKTKDSEEGKNHLVSKNTDFELLLKDENRRYFFSGDVGKEGNYINSSIEYWKKNSPLIALINMALPQGRSLSALPYKSVIILPIRGALKSQSNDLTTLGFLCIDSRSSKCFRERYDVYLGATYADALYHLLREYMVLLVDLASVPQEKT